MFKGKSSIKAEDMIQWMPKTELLETFKIEPIKNLDHVEGDILGLVGGEVLTEKEHESKNMLIIGGAGTGKTSCGLIPQVYEMIKRGESLILNDRSHGDLYERLKPLLEKEGYDIKVLAFNDKNSNMLHQTVNDVINQGDISLTAPAESKCAYFAFFNGNDPDIARSANEFISEIQGKLKMLTTDAGSKVCTVPVNFILDEAALLGRIDQLPQMISRSPARRISYLLCVQSLIQLVGLYPEPQWQIIMDACTTKMYYGAGDFQTEEILLRYSGNKYNSTNKAELVRLRSDKNVLILIDDKKPIKAERFFYGMHPMSDVI